MAGVGNGGGGGGGGNIRAGRAFVELYAEDNKVYRALDRLKARFSAFAGLTIKAGLALGAGGAAALAPLTAALGTLDEQGKLLGAANALGIDPQKASELFGIMRAGGSDLRDAVEGLAQFGARVDEGVSGKGDVAAELFSKLNVSAAEFKALKPEERFYKLLDAVKSLSDPTDRLNVLMKAVGEDTGKNLANVLSLSADEMRELGAASSMSAEQLKDAQTASVRWKIATATLGSVWGQVAQALAPALTSFANWLKTVVQPFGAWVKENRAAVVLAVQVAAGIAGVGLALVGLGLAAKVGAIALGGVVLVLKGIALAVGAILSPVGLVVAAVGGLGALLLTQTETGRGALETMRNTFSEIGSTFSETWGGIVAAVQKGDLELAFKIAGAGIKAAWQQLLLGLMQAWRDFGKELTEGPLGKFNDMMARKTGIGVMTGDITKVVDYFVAQREQKVNEALAELRALTAMATAPAAPKAMPDELKYLNYGAQKAGVGVGSTGSFSAAQAAQRFSLFDDVPLKQLQEQKKANVALNAINKNIGGIVGALAFR